MSEVHKIIAIYGSGGSYKTTTAINIAKAIEKLDGTADIALIGLDATKPLLPILFPMSKDNGISLGKILSSEYFEQDTILRNMKLHEKIAVIGYNVAENYNTYAFPIDSRIDDFIMQMRHIVNYTIIDCTSNVVLDKLTAKAIINADIVFELLSCDLAGLTFYASQESILLSEQYNYGGFKRVLTLTADDSVDVQAVSNAVMNVVEIIPFSTSLLQNLNMGNGFDSFNDMKYNKAIKNLAEMLLIEED